MNSVDFMPSEAAATLAALRENLARTEERLRHFEDANLDLRAKLALAESEQASPKDDPELRQMYEQLKYKDNRIMELNNVIMEKERLIMDLQELCREQSQVAKSKKMAVAIVNRRLQELDERQTCDAATEVDAAMLTRPTARTTERGSTQLSTTQRRNESPGRAISQRVSRSSGGGNSPPPVDPSEDFDESAGWSDAGAAALFSRRDRKSASNRKRVTFDFDARAQHHALRSSSAERDLHRTDWTSGSSDLNAHFADELQSLAAENKRLRAALAEARQKPNAITAAAPNVEHRDTEMDSTAELSQMTTLPNRNAISIVETDNENRTRILKARAAAQLRIRELEENIANLQMSSTKELENLRAVNETLKTSREWLLEENAELLKKNEQLKTKVEDLHGELDASVDANLLFRTRLEEAERRAEAFGAEMSDVRRSMHHAIDTKQVLLSEVERLKEALAAQDEFISVLEGDLIVYEEHVGMLRDSLGATKKEQRQSIKTKAYEAKLNAIEMEKQEIVKRSNDDRLLAKALNVKVRCLEKERDELLQRIRRYEEAQRRASVVSATETAGAVHRAWSSNDATVSLPPLLHPQARGAVPRAASSTPSPDVSSSTASSPFAPIALYSDNGADGWQSPSPQLAPQPEAQLLESEVVQKTEADAELSAELIAEHERQAVEEARRELEEAFRHRLDESSNRLADFERRVSASDAEIADLISRNESLIGERDAEIETRTKLERQIAEIYHRCGDNGADTTVVGQLDEIAAVVIKLRAELATASERQCDEARNVERLTADLTTMRGTVRELESSKIGLIALNDKLSEKSDNLTQMMEVTSAALSECESRLAEAERTLAESEMQCGRLAADLAAERERCAALADAKTRAEFRLGETDKRLLEILVDKENLEQKVALLQDNNSYLSATLEREKGRLERLVDLLRREVDRFRVEAELSRNCLEDLRLNAAYQRSPIPQQQQEQQQHHNQQLVFEQLQQENQPEEQQFRQQEILEPLQQKSEQSIVQEQQLNLEQHQVQQQQIFCDEINKQIEEHIQQDKEQQLFEQQLIQQQIEQQSQNFQRHVEQQQERIAKSLGEQQKPNQAESFDAFRDCLVVSDSTQQPVEQQQQGQQQEQQKGEQTLEQQQEQQKLEREVGEFTLPHQVVPYELQATNMCQSAEFDVECRRTPALTASDEARHDGGSPPMDLEVTMHIVGSTDANDKKPSTEPNHNQNYDHVETIAPSNTSMIVKQKEMAQTHTVEDLQAEESHCAASPASVPAGESCLFKTHPINRSESPVSSLSQKPVASSGGSVNPQEISHRECSGGEDDEDIEESSSDEFERHMLADINQLLLLKSELETSVDVLKSEIWSLNEQLRKQLSEHEEAAERLRACEALLAAADGRLRERDADVERLRQQLAANGDAFARIRDEKAKIEAESAALVQKCAQLQQELAAQEHCFEELAETRRLADTLEAHNDELCASLDGERAIVADLRAALDSRQAELRTLAEEKTRIDAESDALRVELRELQASYDALATKDAAVATADKNVGTLVPDSEESDFETDKQSQPQQQQTAQQRADGAISRSLPALPPAAGATVADGGHMRRKYRSLGSGAPLSASFVHPLNLQLAILAARLDAKSADAAALVRANTELAHTNARLLATVEALEARIRDITTARNDSAMDSIVNTAANPVVDPAEDNGPIPERNYLVDSIEESEETTAEVELVNPALSSTAHNIILLTARESVDASLRVSKTAAKPKAKTKRVKSTKSRPIESSSAVDEMPAPLAATAIPLGNNGFAATRLFDAALGGAAALGAAVSSAANEAAAALSELKITSDSNTASGNEFGTLLDGLRTVRTEAATAIRPAEKSNDCWNDGDDWGNSSAWPDSAVENNSHGDEPILRKDLNQNTFDCGDMIETLDNWNGNDGPENDGQDETLTDPASTVLSNASSRITVIHHGDLASDTAADEWISWVDEDGNNNNDDNNNDGDDNDGSWDW